MVDKINNTANLIEVAVPNNCNIYNNAAVVLLHSIIKLSPDSVSAQVQTQLSACLRFEMVKISDSCPDRK